MKFFRLLRDKIWDILFLDFYFDKRWTLRFKIMNLISDDALREYFTTTYYHINRIADNDDIKSENHIHIKRAKYWMNVALEEWTK